MPWRSAAVVPLLVLLCLSALPAAGEVPAFGEPVLLGDLEPGPASSLAAPILVLGDRAVFVLQRSADGGPVRELWTTDGTPEGTFRLDPDGSGLRLTDADPRQAGDLVYFDTRPVPDAVSGVWRTDGTPEGTVLLVPGQRFTTATRLATTADGLTVFAAQVAWFAEGTADDLRQRLTPPPPPAFLWSTDGTPEGTGEILDLSPLSPLGRGPVELAGRVYFLETDPAGAGDGLWRTDGTAGGTERVTVPPGGSFRSLWATADGLLLHQRRFDGDISLWASDGSAQGTREVRNFGGLLPSGRMVLDLLADLEDGRTVWQVATDTVAPSVWVSDGTPAGTFQLLRAGFPAEDHTDIVGRGILYDGRVYFVRRQPGPNPDLTVWRTDGTVEGTVRFLAERPDLDPEPIAGLQAVAGRLVLAIDHPELGLEPWVSDGTAEGTRPVADLCPGSCDSRPDPMQEAEGFAVFSALGAPGAPRQLWATDLTAAGTRPITDLAGGVPAVGLGLRPLIGDRLLFVADDGVHGQEPWAVRVFGTVPFPPDDPWLRTAAVPGFEIKVRITPAEGGVPTPGSLEPACIPETACISGAVPGRSEVFVRVVGPKPNGFLWPTLVKFSTSRVEVWIRQQATGVVRFYELAGAAPGFDELPGRFDRTGFVP